MPTVPRRCAFGGLIVAIPDSSDIPQASQIGRPSAVIRISVSWVIAAAPETAMRTWSRPIPSRIFDSTSRSASRCLRPSPNGTDPVRCLASTAATDVAIAHSASRFLTGLGSLATLVSIPVWTLYQICGTAPKTVGRASVSAARIVLVSLTQVSCVPKAIWL